MTPKRCTIIIHCFSFALLFLTGCDKASLSNRAAGDIIKAHFDKSRLLLPMRGAFNVVGGSFDWNHGTLSESNYRAIIALSKLGLITATVDRDYENYKKGNGFSWEQWRQQTQDNVIAKVALTPTKTGLEFASAENKDLLHLPMGTFTVTEVVRNDKKENGVNVYRIVMVKYSANWNPLFQKFLEFGGEKPQTKRKAMALLKWDSFKSQWIVIASDMANEDQNFTTDDVQRGLESPQGTAQESTSPTMVSIEPHAISKTASRNQSEEHGTTFHIRIYRSEDPVTGERQPLALTAQKDTGQILTSRLLAMGFADPTYTEESSDLILVRLKNLKTEQIESVRKILQMPAKLDFRVVDPESDSKLRAIDAKKGIIYPEWTILRFSKKDNPDAPDRRLLVHRVPDITGGHIRSASAAYDTEGWHINIEFDREAGEKFSQITKAMHVGTGRFAIVLDNMILSAPTTQAEGGISGGSCRITGNFTEREARELANSLMNPLRNPVKIEEERSQ